ncbi:hypothetical protein LSH36_891g01005 [Paralvinella palmiformis]|uniref:Uncharacterized protein n=1 Tax=Paralvinella palmiformis TaxID=53620 RepID=A0AAD9IXU5_9ANNE|nr:hypothetical protein LSH36_891g01005 [Paralvinella palmiformis]
METVEAPKRDLAVNERETMVQLGISLVVVLMLAKCIHGQEAVTGSDTTETSRTVTPPKGPGKEVCTNKTETTFGLWCYDCQQNFAKVYDPENAVCLFDLSQVALRQCGPRDKYCKIAASRRFTILLSLTQTCSNPPHTSTPEGAYKAYCHYRRKVLHKGTAITSYQVLISD